MKKNLISIFIISLAFVAGFFIYSGKTKTDKQLSVSPRAYADRYMNAVASCNYQEYVDLNDEILINNYDKVTRSSFFEDCVKIKSYDFKREDKHYENQDGLNSSVRYSVVQTLSDGTTYQYETTLSIFIGTGLNNQLTVGHYPASFEERTNLL